MAYRDEKEHLRQRVRVLEQDLDEHRASASESVEELQDEREELSLRVAELEGSLTSVNAELSQTQGEASQLTKRNEGLARQRETSKSISKEFLRGAVVAAICFYVTMAFYLYVGRPRGGVMFDRIEVIGGLLLCGLVTLLIVGIGTLRTSHRDDVKRLKKSGYGSPDKRKRNQDRKREQRAERARRRKK